MYHNRIVLIMPDFIHNRGLFVLSNHDIFINQTHKLKTKRIFDAFYNERRIVKYNNRFLFRYDNKLGFYKTREFVIDVYSQNPIISTLQLHSKTDGMYYIDLACCIQYLKNPIYTHF